MLVFVRQIIYMIHIFDLLLDKMLTLFVKSQLF